MKLRDFFALPANPLRRKRPKHVRATDPIRRRMLQAFVPIAVLVAADPSAAGSLIFKGGRTVVSGGFSVTGAGDGEDYFAYAPMLFDKTVYRNLQVGTNEEAISIMGEMCHGFSPSFTTATVTGADAANFAAGPTAGTIVVNPSVRATLAPGSYNLTIQLTNAGGSSATATLTVVIVPNANAYFISYGSGNDANSGTTPATAKKYLPGSDDYTGSAKVFGPGDVVFMKAEVHRTAHVKTISGAPQYSCGHAGNSSSLCVVEWNGWGGRATLSGDKVITGWTSVTQAEVGGNPNYANIKKLDLTSQGGAAEYCQFIFDNETQLFPAIYPTPTDLTRFWMIDYGATHGSERYGMAVIPCSTSATPRRMYTNGATADAAGTTVTIVDPQFAADFGNVAASTLPQFTIWGAGNHIYRLTVATYDYATSTITLSYTGNLSLDGSNTAYCYSWAPTQIVQAGQYALSTDGLTVYAWLPNNGTTSIARLRNGVAWGHDGYVKYNGGLFQRFAGSTSARSGSKAGGRAFHNYISNAFLQQSDVDGAWIRQCMSEDGDGVIHGSNGSGGETAGIQDTNIYRVRMYENPRSSGIRFASKWKGRTGGTWAQIRSYASGRFRGIYIKPNGVQQTCLYFATCDGVHVYENVFRDIFSVHGNGISLYDQSSTIRCQNAVIECNALINCARAYTTNVSTTNRNVYFGENFLLAAKDQLYCFSPWGGEPGGTINRNLMLGYDSSYAYSYTAHFKDGCEGGYITNNVIAGCVANPAWGGQFNNNLITVNQTLSASTGTGTSSGNTVLTGGSQVWYWSGSLTSQMIATLGAGRLGPFITI